MRKKKTPTPPQMRLSAKERRILACHEAGHAIVSAVVQPTIPIRSIIIRFNRQNEYGGTSVFPRRNLATETEMANLICTLYGGYAAEGAMLREVSDASHDDLVRITDLLTWMVQYLGMNDLYRLPPMFFDPRKHRFSETLLEMLDESKCDIAGTQLDRAALIVYTNLPLLQEMTDYLECHGRLSGKVLELFLLRIEKIPTEDADAPANEDEPSNDD
jgi:cell division protease FtsH